MALVHRERVEDPRHRRGVRADVRRRDVFLGPDLVDDLRGEATRHALELAARHRLRIAHDAALGAAEGQAHQRALPRHPHRERLHLVERDVRVVADAALRRAARDVVRDAPPREGAHRAVVHRRRDRDLDRLLALAENGDQVVVDAEGRRRRSGAAAGRSGTGSRGGESRVPQSPFASRSLLQPERHLRAGSASRRRERRPGDEPQLVRAGSEAAARRAAPGDAEAVAPGQQVAEPRQHAEEFARRRCRAGCRAGATGSICSPSVAHDAPAWTLSIAGSVSDGVNDSRADRGAAEQVSRPRRERRAPTGYAACSAAGGARSIVPVDDSRAAAPQARARSRVIRAARPGRSTKCRVDREPSARSRRRRWR